MRTRVGILRDRYLYRGMGPTGTEGRFGFEVDGEVEVVARDALLDLFGARVEVRAMNPGEKRCVVGLAGAGDGAQS